MEGEGYNQKQRGRGRRGGCRRGRRGGQKGNFGFPEGDGGYIQYQPEFSWDDGRWGEGHFGPTRGRGRGRAMPPINGGWENGRGGGGRGRSRRRPREEKLEAAESNPLPPPVAAVTSFQAGQFPNDADVHGTKPMPLSDNSDNTFTPSSDKVVPVTRPDKGGTTAIRNTKLRVNHFPVRFNPQSTIRHYDVNVKPEEVHKESPVPKLSKSSLRMIRDKLFSDDPSHFPMSMTAYDGEKNIFSAVPLPTGQYKVELSDGQDMPSRTYIFSIKLVNELKLFRLKDYLTGNLFSIPREVLQGMDVVMKENPVRNMICTGRSFHPVDGHRDVEIGHGIRASKGFQHSLKPTFQGLSMCLDYSVLAFRKRMPVLDFLKEHINGFNLNDFRRFRRDVEKSLRGLKVNVTHRMTRQKFVVSGLTKDNARRLKFVTEDPSCKAAEISLVEYFRDKYKMDIMYKDIPCLELGKLDRKNYVPMELCVLVEGQIYPKEQLDRNAAIFLKRMSLAKPDVRKSTICSMVKDAEGNGPCGGEVIRNFGMEIDTNMTSVVGRVIGAPELKLCNSNGAAIRVPVDKDKCQWNLLGKRVVEGKSIARWGVVDFSSSDRHRLNPRRFIPNLITRCRNLGMLMEEPLFVEPSNMHMFSNTDALQELLESLNDRAYRVCQGKLQILICVMSGKHPGYKNLKWISETRVGLVTQCCLSFHANEGNDQYLANLALKINAKLGGSNAELYDRFPFFEGRGGGVMFIGADVNHPASRNTTSPSISAVVATVNWPAANRYAARVRPQNNRIEKIVSFGDMCLELVESYARLNKGKPEKVVIFRDGVSEGQFDMVLNEELLDMKRAFHSNNYNPTITLIVAQKRHQTRLFPENQRDGGFTGNVSPGTVVDTKIVHPFEFDFYLCSHYGSLGTSKPTHYHVLWDEHGFTSDQVQKLIYNLCFTFARCTKPVSLVPPVYYADLVAYRGRLYYEAVMEGHSPTSVGSTASSTASSSASSSTTSLDDRFYRLHADLENDMFFI
ncbi:Protein argonaute 2 [Linum perenne]